MPEETEVKPEETVGEQPKVDFFDKLKTHKFKILGGILGVLVLVGAVFGAYKLGQKQVQPGPLPTPTPVVEATPTPDPTANWKTYTNTKYGYEIKYPTNWQVEEDVNYVSPDRPNYTFFFKEKIEFMPGVSAYVVSKTTPGKWIGADTLKLGLKKEILVGRTQGIRVLNIPGVLEQEWVFLDKADHTIIFYASGGKEELATLNLMLSTFKFLE